MSVFPDDDVMLLSVSSIVSVISSIAASMPVMSGPATLTSTSGAATATCTSGVATSTWTTGSGQERLITGSGQERLMMGCSTTVGSHASSSPAREGEEESMIWCSDDPHAVRRRRVNIVFPWLVVVVLLYYSFGAVALLLFAGL